MKNVKLKNTIWHIYREELKLFLAVSILLGSIYIVYINFSDILSIIYIIFENMTSLFNSMCTFTIYYTNRWCIFTSCIIILILTSRFIIFLFYQQYIPLTKSELKDNNITNISEYFAFLSSILMGFIPKRFLYPICLSAYKYLMDASEKKELYDKYYEEITHEIESHPNWYSDNKILSIQEIDNYNVETDVNKNFIKNGFLRELIYRIIEDLIYTDCYHNDNIFNITFKRNHKTLCKIKNILICILCINILLFICIRILPEIVQFCQNLPEVPNIFGDLLDNIIEDLFL